MIIHIAFYGIHNLSYISELKLAIIHKLRNTVLYISLHDYRNIYY